MKRQRLSFKNLTVIWACLACPFVVFAAPNESRFQFDRDSQKVFNDQSDGQLSIYLFSNGLPANNITVITPVGEKSSNASGVITVKLSAKDNHEIFIPQINKKISVKITPGFESQIIVNLLSEDKSEVDVETPQGNLQSVVSTAPKVLQRFQVTGERGPVDGATVLFSGVESVVRTDEKGMVQIQLPIGEVSATFFHPEYQTLTMNNLKVEKESHLAIPVELKPSFNQLEDVVVLAPKVKGSLSALVEVRKQSSAVTDVLGAEQMTRAGDGDAAASLRRVTGLTLVNGKYVYVRGLGERYSGVLMNQFALPSPEPSRRVVPLDLFPTSIMESIVVQKSYSPDLNGEFGGGVIQLQTKTLPEAFFMRATIAANYENSQNRLGYQGGSKDWLGMDDGSRQLPGAIQNVLNQGLKLTKNIPGEDKGLSEEQLTALGQSLSNNYNTERTSSPSLPNLAVSMGNGWRFGAAKLGTASSVLYGQSIDNFQRTSRGFNVGAGGKLEKDFERSSTVANTDVRLGGSVDVGVELFADHKINASAFILRHTSSLAQQDTTVRQSSGGNITDATTLDWVERQLLAQHLKGQHNLQKIVNYPIKVDWRYGVSQADRNSKDRRNYMYDVINGAATLATGSAGNMRTFSPLKDNTQELAMDITIPWVHNDRDIVKFKMGFNHLEKNRRSDVTRLYFDDEFSGASKVDLSQDVNHILDPENRKPGYFTLKNLTNEADSYSGSQSVNAQYFLTEVSPWKEWSFQGGFRREQSLQSVKTFKYFDPGHPSARSELEMNDILPAYSITWRPNDNLRGRLAYSETLARPDFREISTVGFIDDETGYNVLGNANLKGTVIRNIDHRWEYYWSADEYMSVGVFSKNFKNPIEVMFIPGVNRIQSFANAQAANNFGLEIENRTGLRHFSRELRRWTVLSNLTLIRSQIELDEKNRGIQTSNSRPLQGQSPYVINLQLQYDRPQWGFSSTLLYNIVGKRITEVGTNDIPDTYEQPFNQLDFVASQKIGKFWTLGFRARNLLNPKIESTQNEEVVRSYQRGRFFGLNLGVVL